MPVSMVCDSGVSAALRDSLTNSSSSSSTTTSRNDDHHHNLQTQLVASTKRVLLKKIEYEEVNSYKTSVLDSLKSKYIVLKPNNIIVGKPVLAEKDNCLNGHNSMPSASSGSSSTQSKDVQLPAPKRILFPRDYVQIGWKNSNRKWQVGAGMTNMGNTCYLNSTLQAIFHVPALANWLMSDEQHREKCENLNGSQGGCIICAVSKTLISSQSNQSIIKPWLVYSKLRLVCKHLVPGRQEDAHEFLRYLMEAMEKAYLSRFKNSKELDQYSKETTPLNQILGGYLRSNVRCLACGHVSTTFQHFEDLLLDIRKANTVEEALDSYFARERLEDMGYKCESCKKKVSATKQFSLERAPIVLCIQLKRFSVAGTKLNKQVTIRPKLDLSPYSSKRSNEVLTYRLVSMVTHIGTSQVCGHYTAIGLTDAGGYYQFDDSCVRPISMQNVLSTNTYIIFYELDDNIRSQVNKTSTATSRECSSLLNGSYNNEENFVKSKLVIKDNENGTNSTNAASSSSTLLRNNYSVNSISKLESSPGFIGPLLPSHMNGIVNENKSKSIILNGSEKASTINGGNLTKNNIDTSSKLVKHNGIVTVLPQSPTTSNNLSNPNYNLGSKLVIHCINKPHLNGNASASTSSSSSSSTSLITTTTKISSNSISPKKSILFSLNPDNKVDEKMNTLPSMPKLTDDTFLTPAPHPKEKQHSPLLPKEKSHSPSHVHIMTTPTKVTITNGHQPSTSAIAKKLFLNGTTTPPIRQTSPSPLTSASASASTATTMTTSAATTTTPTTAVHLVNKPKSLVPYESDDESNQSEDEAPVIKTKAGIWQVSEATENNVTINETPNINQSQKSNGQNKLNSLVLVNNCKYKKMKMTENGTEKVATNGDSMNVVNHLLKMGHRGYSGAPVYTWNGQKSSMEKEVTEEKRVERKRTHENNDDEMDRGHCKKNKINGPIGRDNPGYNPFQEYQNQKNRNNWITNRRYNNNYINSNQIYRQNPHNRNHTSFRVGRHRDGGKFHNGHRHHHNFHRRDN